MGRPQMLLIWYYMVASEIKHMMLLPVEIERLARLVAGHSGKAPEDVLKEALENQARLVGISTAEILNARARTDMDRVRQITHRVASKPLVDSRSPKQILDQAWGKRAIVVDSSALVALLEEEPEADQLLRTIRDSSPRFVDAVTVYQCIAARPWDLEEPHDRE
jgi:antitoxin VapB